MLSADIVSEPTISNITRDTVTAHVVSSIKEAKEKVEALPQKLLESFETVG
jgi:hypothetical protein